MTNPWQDLIAGVLVLGAAAYVARQAWRALVQRRTGECGSRCGGCAGGQRPAAVVPLEGLGERGDE